MRDRPALFLASTDSEREKHEHTVLKLLSRQPSKSFTTAEVARRSHLSRENALGALERLRVLKQVGATGLKSRRAQYGMTLPKTTARDA